MLSGCRKLKNVAVFISGGGSTLQSLLDMHHLFDVKLVICNRQSAVGLLKAKRFGKPCLIINKKTTFEEIDSALAQHNISLVFLAGFMKILPADFVNRWANKIYNIHPSLLPAFKGLHAFERSWESKSAMGATIHHVTPEMDEGKIIFQKKCSRPGGTLELAEAELFLRSTEQTLLREFSIGLSL